MSGDRTKHRAFTGPSWRQRYTLGVKLSQALEPVCTYEEIGAALGVTKQNAYTEAMVALGTFAWQLSKRLGVQHVAS